MTKRLSLSVAAVMLAAGVALGQQHREAAKAERPRARELGIRPGELEPGPLNAITDVAGVKVGQVTMVEGKDVRTGVTAILPHGGNLFQEKVAGAVWVFNAFGKLVGATQVEELGQIETPIVLTNTLGVWEAAAALMDWTLAMPGNETVRSVNPVVGETNDGWLNDIRGRHVKAEHVRRALESAQGGAVEEGSIGAGTGTMALGWKGGVGTSSRMVQAGQNKFAVGVLVQTNFGGRLTMDGVPVWKELSSSRVAGGDGSCMIVVATDAPLDARQLKRLAARAILGMARTGASGSQGSGDYVIAFSTTSKYSSVAGIPPIPVFRVREDDLSALFAAVSEATEEAIYNSLLRATTVVGKEGHVGEAIPVERVKEVLGKR